MGDFKELLVAWRYREEAARCLAGLLSEVVVVSRAEQERLIVDAFARGILTMAERDDAILADVVVRGQRCDSESPVLLVTEVAPVIDVTDVDQALQRTMLWAKLGLAVQPAVAGLTISAEGARRAHAGQVLVTLLPEAMDPAAWGRSAPASAARTKRA
jgi:hypothetical protein